MVESLHAPTSADDIWFVVRDTAWRIFKLHHGATGTVRYGRSRVRGRKVLKVFLGVWKFVWVGLER